MSFSAKIIALFSIPIILALFNAFFNPVPVIVIVLPPDYPIFPVLPVIVSVKLWVTFTYGRAHLSIPEEACLWYTDGVRMPASLLTS